MLTRWTAILFAGGLAAACTHYETQAVVVPVADACLAYGFSVGTPEYRECASREAEARRLGRMRVDYGEARIVADAQYACSSYGLMRSSDRYERCVQREVGYRRPA